MEMRFAKVLDSGPHDVELKRKRPARCEPYFTGGTSIVLPMRSTTITKICKRRKLDETKRKYGCAVSPCGKCLLKYYSNFKKSGIPDRLMHYQNDEWNNFPQDVISCVKKEIVKKSALEVDFNGNKILLDLLHMTMMDLNSGLRRPIAWIDVSGNCYFPEIFCDYYGHRCSTECHEGEDDITSESLGSNDINLHVEVEINGVEALKFKESSSESNAIAGNLYAHGKSAEKYCDYEGTDSCARASDVEGDEKCKQNQQNEELMVSAVDLLKEYMNVDALKQLFFQSISRPFQAQLIEIHHCIGTAMNARFEIFQKQIEIMKRYRGDANVHYAWLPCSKGMVASILTYGLGFFEPSKLTPSHGVGIYLIPASGSEISANIFDVDENGAQHMVLCRVIMGKTELVHLGSKQFHPSSENFDSGVDNLQNPKYYIVWNMNMHSHIYPESVVSFKVSSDVEGPQLGMESIINVSSVTTCHETSPVMGNYGNQDKAKTSQVAPAMKGLSSARFPKSPWIPFPVLFDVISNKISSKNMELVRSNYDLLKNKTINRDEFVKRLRLIVGDTLLKSAIISLPNKCNSDADVKSKYGIGRALVCSKETGWHLNYHGWHSIC